MHTGRDKRIAGLEHERRDHDRAMSEKSDGVRGKERELQTKVVALQVKERELVNAREALKNWET